jgi:hypothetical protein
MFIQKDTYPSLLKDYKASVKTAVNAEHNDITDKIKPLKWTTNLIEDIRVTESKTLPIQNSHLKKPPVIRPYSQFKGALALPTFKKDLQAWHIC